MCGRYALYGPHSRVTERLLLKYCPEYGERYNIAPQSDILVIRQKPGVGRVGQLVKWGLVTSRATDPSIGHKLTNARGETVAEKPSFKSSFIKHRCLIPANGFYEWKTIDVGVKPKKQPYYIHPTDSTEFFAFAGLLAVWRPPEGDPLVTACIITTGANEAVQPIHDRMPVILQPEHYDYWLDPENQEQEALLELMRPCSPDLMSPHPVSPSINSGRVEGAECIEPLPPE